MFQLARTSALLIALLSCLLLAQQTTDNLSVDEYAVMGAMLDGFREAGRASHPTVADYTSTFDCDSICNGMKIGRCNGLTGNDETATERLAIVKRDIPDVERATIADFKAKNRHCSKVSDKIPSSSPFFVFGSDHAEKLPSGWDHADFFYFSRAGFNGERTQALVNVSFYSGTDAASSGGKYFLLTKQNGKWIPKESSIVWQMAPPQHT